MFSTTEKFSLSVGEAAEIGHVDVILPTPSHSNPKPASVESLAPPVPVLPTVHENRPPALPAPKPTAPTRSAAPAPVQPAPAPQARPAQPQTRAPTATRSARTGTGPDAHGFRPGVRPADRRTAADGP